MGDLLGEALATVALGFVTGAFGATIVGVAVMRRLGEERFQGRRVKLYLVACVVVFVAMATYTIARPWLRG